MHAASEKTYKDKLLDPRWQKRRLMIFRRDGWKCRSCQTESETLHVHHLYYVKGKEPWDYPRRALLTVCHKCHQAAHKGKMLVIAPNPRSPREMGTNLRRLAGAGR